MLYALIDENGFFIKDVIYDGIGLDTHYIIEPVPQGFYLPKWNGTEWIEGLTDEEIAEITKPVLQEPTIEERLEQTEQIVQMTTMALTEFVFMQSQGKL